MFGIFAMILGEIFRFKEDRKEYVYNTKARKNPNPKTNTYYDRCGRMRDADTNQPRYTSVTKNRDLIIKDVHGNVLRNITEEERKAEFVYQKNNHKSNRTVYVWNVNDHHDNEPNKVNRDVWHVDFETGDVYVVKKVKEFRKDNDIELECFMDIKTNKLVRITDIQKERFDTWKLCGGKTAKRVMTDDQINEFIDRANRNDGIFSIRELNYQRSIGTPYWED